MRILKQRFAKLLLLVMCLSAGTLAQWCDSNCLKCSYSLFSGSNCEECREGYVVSGGECKKKSSYIGALVGGIIGAVAFIVIIVLLSYCCCCRETTVQTRTTVVTMQGQHPGNQVVIGPGGYGYGGQPMVITTNNMAPAQYYQQPQQVYYQPQNNQPFPQPYQQQPYPQQPYPQQPPALEMIHLENNLNNQSPQNEMNNEVNEEMVEL